MDGTGDIFIIYRIWFCTFIEYVYLEDTLIGIFFFDEAHFRKQALF